MNTMSTKDIALAWRASGVVPLPLLPKSKIAAVKWRRWQKQVPPAALVKSWFAQERNLGLLCGGPSGLIALDFDAVGSFVRWANQHKDLAQTYSVGTKRGRHLYFYTDTTAQTMITVAMAGVDIKLSGYIVAPPSTHPDGKHYKAIDNRAPILRLPSLQDALTGLDPLPTPEVQQEDTPSAPPLYMCASVGQSYNLYYGVIKDIRHALPTLALAQRYTTMLVSDGGAGRWWLGRCPNPLHEDVHPSFRVDAIGNFARCLTPGCKLYEPRGMDTVELYRRLHGLRSRDAIAALAVELGLVNHP